MKPAISEAEIQELLAAIERGDVELTPMEEPQAVYCAVVGYVASNGWKLGVFNDCNEWDYIDWIEAPDGRLVEDALDGELYPSLVNHAPEDAVAWERYGLPGHMAFRCTRCGEAIRPGHDNVFLCASCKKSA